MLWLLRCGLVLARILAHLEAWRLENWVWRACYRRYLRTPHWRQLRRFCFRRDNWQCVLCGQSRTLEAHHLPGSYIRLCRERLDDLLTLCDRCHRRLHNRVT